MIALVLGGAASGKSEYAEKLVLQYSGRRIYLATMENTGETAKRRIQRHRELRKEKGFETIEKPRSLEELTIENSDVLLLECVSNLFANEMFAGANALSGMEAARKALTGVQAVCRQSQNTVIVSNNVFDDGIIYDPFTEDYIAGMGWLNQQLAQLSDQIVEVVCGIPLIHKKAGL